METGKSEEPSEKASLNQAAPPHKHWRITLIAQLTSAGIAFNFPTLSPGWGSSLGGSSDCVVSKMLISSVSRDLGSDMLVK